MTVSTFATDVTYLDTIAHPTTTAHTYILPPTTRLAPVSGLHVRQNFLLFPSTFHEREGARIYLVLKDYMVKFFT